MQLRTASDKFLKTINRKVMLFYFIIVIFFSVLIARLFYLQIINYEKYKTLSDNNRIRVVRIFASRGMFLDRKGVVFVKNSPSYNLTLLKEDVKDIKGTIEKLSSVLNINAETFYKKIKNSYPYVPIVIKRGLSFEDVSYFMEHAQDFPGVKIELETARKYEDGEAVSHIVGYTGEVNMDEIEKFGIYFPGDIIGKTGLERYYEPILKGKNGLKYVEVDSLGQAVSVSNVKEPIAGNNIALTIDFNMQKYAKELFAGKKGAAVILKIDGNEVITLFSAPTFDLNSFVPYISEQTWKELHNEHKPLINRATESAYPPGSVFKVLMAIASLNEKVITPSTAFNCNGEFNFGNFTYKCWNKDGHGSVSLKKSIAESCDVYYYNVGLKLGIDNIAKYAKNFGLGSKTGIDLPVESAGNFPDRDWKKKVFKQPWYHGETIITSIGQGYMTTTPLQLAVMLSGIFNGGKIYKPRLLDKIITPDGVFKINSELVREIPITKESINLVLDAVTETVMGERGTAYRAKVEGIMVGGKTGTAQVVGLKKTENMNQDQIPEKYRDHSWFGGVFPSDNPQYVIVVFVEHGGAGSSGATPIAGALINKMVQLGYVTGR
ncbi:MAG: penicillin-binding protein 2 [Calditerrivibrio sp.]|nr:penicillin-binding protein 2 [Calditerrivibrio sp.]